MTKIVRRNVLHIHRRCRIALSSRQKQERLRDIYASVIRTAAPTLTAEDVIVSLSVAGERLVDKEPISAVL